MLLLGNALDVLKTIDAALIDLVVTSPPYDNLRTYNGYSFDFEGIASELHRVLKPGGVIIWVVGDSTTNGSESGNSFKQALYFKNIGLNLHDTMIYQKATFKPLTHNRYEQCFEYMFVLSRGRPKTFHGIKDKRNTSFGRKVTGKWVDVDGSRKPHSGIGKPYAEFGLRQNIWTMYNATSSFGHPAPFPYQLAHDHILSWSNPGDIVLDPFIGSGTTALAASNLGRKYIGIDVSDEYLKIVEERLRDKSA